MEIQWVTDKNGNDFYPVTHQKAVIVDGSKTLDKKLTELESDISNKANPSSIPTNVSQLTNDSNYQTEAQVKSTVSNEVAKIVADAPENYDTLKEISDWISGHENDASAMNSAIKDNKNAITTLQTEKANKTEIPTELPANGGNSATVNGHTVKSDVPENAVFTDTNTVTNIGTDSNNYTNGNILIQGSGATSITKSGNTITISSTDNNTWRGIQDNLSSASATDSLSANQGKILNETKMPHKTITTATDLNTLTDTCIYHIKATANTNSPSDGSGTLYVDYKVGTPYQIFVCDGSTIKAYKRWRSKGVWSSWVELQLTDTVYDDTEVKESISAQSTEITEIKMLGWSVPKECPVQNEVNGNQFVQKVGRVDLGSLGWRYDGANYGRFISDNLKGAKTPSSNDVIANIFLQGYQVVTTNNLLSVATNYLVAYSSGNVISIRNTSYTNPTEFKNAMQGQYLYYELATPITTTIDGNEIGETVSDVRKETIVNLLSPTLETTTQNGVTCTNNGDGTYTLKGTASAGANFFLRGSYGGHTPIINKVGRFKLTPLTRTYVNLRVQLYHNVTALTVTDNIVTVTQDTLITLVNVQTVEGVTYNNEIIKPMLTTNLSATYDDFVPYTGDSGSLNGDVAELRENFDNLVELGEDITD